jgi:hypothetical protein
MAELWFGAGWGRHAAQGEVAVPNQTTHIWLTDSMSSQQAPVGLPKDICERR